METKYYTVERITGDYAYLRRTDAQEAEPLMITLALLPDGVDEGTNLKWEMFTYEIV